MMRPIEVVQEVEVKVRLRQAEGVVSRALITAMAPAVAGHMESAIVVDRMVVEATEIVASTMVAMEVGDTVATSRGIGKAVERSVLSDVHRQHAAGVANDWSRWGSKCNWSGQDWCRSFVCGFGYNS